MGMSPRGTMATAVKMSNGRTLSAPTGGIPVIELLFNYPASLDLLPRSVLYSLLLETFNFNLNTVEKLHNLSPRALLVYSQWNLCEAAWHQVNISPRLSLASGNEP